jgi:hypothetical protein
MTTERALCPHCHGDLPDPPGRLCPHCRKLIDPEAIESRHQTSRVLIGLAVLLVCVAVVVIIVIKGNADQHREEDRFQRRLCPDSIEGTYC